MAIISAYRFFGVIAAIWLGVYVFRKVIAFGWIPALTSIGLDINIKDEIWQGVGFLIEVGLSLALVIFVFQCSRAMNSKIKKTQCSMNSEGR